MTESGKPVPNEIIHASDVYSKQEVADLITDKTRSNLLRPILKTASSNGITATNNGDGTFTINGTATGNAVFILAYVDRMSGCKLIGCPTNNSGSYLAILRGSIDAWTNVIMDRGDGAEISLDTKRNPVVIGIETGLTVDNVVFKPMITDDLSATYDDFVSYDDSFVKGINSGIKLDLLWTNASPTSSFSTQDLSIDSTKYRAILIEVCEYGGVPARADNKFSNIVFKAVGGSVATYYYLDGTYILSFVRTIYVLDDRIYISDSSDNHGINNVGAIPQRIWGIK